MSKTDAVVGKEADLEMNNILKLNTVTKGVTFGKFEYNVNNIDF